MPGLGDRFVAVQVSSWTKSRQWGVEDLSKRDDNLVKDWRQGKRDKVWRGTEAQARELAALMSKQRDDIVSITNGEMSKSQKIIRGAQRRMVARERPAVRQGAFRKCDTCGTMYKGEKHCE